MNGVNYFETFKNLRRIATVLFEHVNAFKTL